MKIALFYLFLAIVAVGGGVGAAYVYHNAQVANTTEGFYSNQWVVSDPSTLVATAVVDATTWDAGVADPARSYTHDFVVLNEGTKPLEVWVNQQPTGPISIDLTQAKAKVGVQMSYPITVRFKGSDIQEDVDQELVVQTNQPDDEPIRLRIKVKAPN